MVMAVSSPALPHTQEDMPATTGLLQDGRYRIDHPISESSNCSVFQAYDTVSDSKVVVKEIAVRLSKVTTLSQQEGLKLAFSNHAKLLAEVKHPALVRVNDYFSEIGRQYLVLESIEGDDLQSLISQIKKPFSLAEVADWADRILDGLHYLHNLSEPIIHKNVQPRNLRLFSDGNVKLLAHGTGTEEPTLNTSISEDTIENAILNFSPLELIWDGLDSASQKVILGDYDERSERVLKSPPDARSDIYSVGATLYFLLTARMPVDPLERSIEILEGNPDPLKSPHKVDPSIPTEVSDVIMRAMEIKRESRFDSAVIMRQVLRTSFVKIQERAAQEARELEEAAEDLRFAEKVRQDQIQALVEQKARELEQEKQRQSELLEQKLREAEELRLAAERRAAEAERLLREQEAQRTKIENAIPSAQEPTISADPVFEDDLLGIKLDGNTGAQPDTPVESFELDMSFAPDRSEQEVVAFAEVPLSSHEQDDSQLLSEIELGSIEESTPENTATDPEFVGTGIPASVVIEEPTEPVEKVKFESEVRTYSPATGSSSFDYVDSVDTSRRLPIPVIAGLASCLVLVLAVAGYFMFAGSGTEHSAETLPVPPASTTVAAPQSSDPKTVEPNSATTDSGILPDTSPEKTEQSQVDLPGKSGAKPAPAKTIKPASEPTKAPEKKKVTVDDLINDN